jgi:hypothetical protein
VAGSAGSGASGVSTLAAGGRLVDEVDGERSITIAALEARRRHTAIAATFSIAERYFFNPRSGASGSRNESNASGDSGESAGIGKMIVEGSVSRSISDRSGVGLISGAFRARSYSATTFWILYGRSQRASSRTSSSTV